MDERASGTATANECSPLLITRDGHHSTSSHNDSDDPSRTSTGQASVVQTVLNLMKACMGMGSLALPYAARQSGLVLFTAGLLAIAAWNVYAVKRLCQCLDYVPPSIGDDGKEGPSSCPRLVLEDGSTDEESEGSAAEIETLEERRTCCPRGRVAQLMPPPPEGTSTLGRVAWYALGGKAGLEVVDFMMLIVLLGILTTYIVAVKSLLGDTPFSLGPRLDAVVWSTIPALLAMVPDIGFLSHASAIGLLVLLLTFLVITGYGIVQYDFPSAIPLALWPESLTGVSRWFGCVVFEFGIVPIAYNFRASMQQPANMVPATWVALMGASIAYIGIGVVLYALFPDVRGEILHELPQSGALPVLTRCSMVWVVLMTAPLLVVPCGQLLEGKWRTSNRFAVRFGVCGVCAATAALLPSLVQALSLVGCTCVGVVGFLLPPLLHLRLMHLSGQMRFRTALLDGAFLTWGLIATVLSTIYTFGKISSAENQQT